MTLKTLRIAILTAALGVFAFMWLAGADKQTKNHGDRMAKREVQKTDEQWKQELTDEEYRILREAGTERAFTGKYYKHKEDGTYLCAGCGNKLFESETKYESGSGWPSFYAPIDKANIDLVGDSALGMMRTEVVCNRCGGHLGHVFDDGPQPTGLRYCINSAALDFKKESADSTEMTTGEGEKTSTKDK